MDRGQIILKLGMDFLGIPVRTECYREICNAAYLAQEIGIHLSSFELYLNERGAFSPRRKIGHDIYSNLFEEVRGIERNGERKEIIDGWMLDKNTLERLKELRAKIQRYGLQELIKKHYSANSSL